MDDTVSKWLLENWYKPNFNHPNMLLACVMARLFNLPEALEEVGFPKRWDPEKTAQILMDRKQLGLNNFNAAYMITMGGQKGKDKAKTYINKLLIPVSQLPAVSGSRAVSLMGLACSLTPLWGVSGFMSGQVVADVRWAIKGLWKDRLTWAAVGPGSSRGMCRLLGKPVRHDVRQEVFEERFTSVRELVSKSLPKIFQRLEAIDIQGCLCEFDKYERVLWKQGRPKRKYQGV
jgi:hypothetical protein